MTPRQTEIVSQIRKLLTELSKSEQPRKQRHVEAGHPNGPPPFGWSAQSRTATERWKRISKPMVRNETEQKIISQVFRMRGEGVSYFDIAQALNRDGYHTRSGGPWHGEAVIRVVKAHKEDAA